MGLIIGVTAAAYHKNRAAILPFLRGFVKRSRGQWTVDALERDILARERQVWKVNDWQALILTRVSAEAVHIDAGAGVRRHEWQDEFDRVARDWARKLGKKYIISMARPGWAKYAKQRGYRETHREMTLEL